jgi:hypothetical protein
LAPLTATWLTTEFALRMLHVDSSRAVSQYRMMMDDEVAHTASAPFEQLNENDHRVLGCETFLAHVHGLAWRPRSWESMDDVIKTACDTFKVAPTDLISRSGKRVLAQARAWIANHCVQNRIASVSEVARRFDRDESTLRESVLRYYPP